MAAQGEFSRGWPVLSAAAVGVGLGLSPLPFYTIGVFIPPLLGEFGASGWDVGFIINALAIYTFGAFASAPIIGLLAERFGARRVALISIITFSLSMMAIGLNTGSKSLYILLWMVLAFAGAGTLPITFTRPVANWFDTNRGIALGIALIATGVFGAMAKFFAQYVTTHADWRTAYFALGLLPLMIALPLNFLALRDLDDEPAKDASATRLKVPVLAISLLATLAFIAVVLFQVTELIARNGVRLEYMLPFVYSVMILIPVGMMMFLRIGTEPPQRAQGTAAAAVSLPGMTLTEALGDWRFWLLAVVFVPISYAVGAIIPNIENVLRANDFDQDTAVGLATLTGLAVLAGRVIGGYLIDRFWAPGVAFVFLASPAIALWMLGQPGVGPNSATFAILLIGFGAGVEYDFMAYMVSRFFGMRSYSAIYGAIYGFFALGAGLGPGIMTNLALGQGLKIIEWDLGILDGHDWQFTLTSAAIILFISTVPLLFLGKYRYGHGGSHEQKAAPADDVAAAELARS
ncbi:MAG: MFS transporter [Pseudomonadota bacterium]